MKFSITREQLLPQLKKACAAVEKRQLMPILGNVLLSTDKDKLSITATDLETQIVATVSLDSIDSDSDIAESITAPALKLLNIITALPKESVIRFKLNDKDKLIVSSGKSRFTLSTIPAEDYPKFLTDDINSSIDISSKELLRALTKTAFSMANQDVRYYLNGLSVTRENGVVKLVGSDGHRLALYTCESEYNSDDMSIIIPRKAVNELIKILTESIKVDDSTNILLQYSQNNVHINTIDTSFTAKLIDSKYPQFDKVYKQDFYSDIVVNKDALKQAVSRVMILSNEKYRGVEFKVNDLELTINTNNPDNEEANEIIDIEYYGDSIDIAFNAQYIIEAISHVSSDNVVLRIAENNSCCFLTEVDDSDYDFIVMPIRM